MHDKISTEELIDGLRRSAKTALDVFDNCAKASDVKVLGEAKDLMTSAVEAIKLAEVLSGGVSDRTARQGDALAKQLESAKSILNSTRKYDAAVGPGNGGDGAQVAANRPRQTGNA